MLWDLYNQYFLCFVLFLAWLRPQKSKGNDATDERQCKQCHCLCGCNMPYKNCPIIGAVDEFFKAFFLLNVAYSMNNYIYHDYPFTFCRKV